MPCVSQAAASAFCLSSCERARPSRDDPVDYIEDRASFDERRTRRVVERERVRPDDRPRLAVRRADRGLDNALA
jgi:hypothetical protein